MKKNIAFLFLRVGLGVVFLVFGIGKFQNDIWAQTMRTMNFFLALPWDVNISVILVGIVEAITGVALITGLFARFFAGTAAIQLMGILVLLKFEEVRDIGLLGAAIYIALIYDESLTITLFWKKRNGGV